MGEDLKVLVLSRQRSLLKSRDHGNAEWKVLNGVFDLPKQTGGLQPSRTS